jgi:hypothetical protein
MSVSIVPSSIKIWIKNKGGYTSMRFFEWGRQKDNHSVLDATAFFLLSEEIKFGGQVRFSLQPLDWQVGFVQVARDHGCKIRYTGRTSTEGSIICTVTRLPPLLDCYENKEKGILPTPPWYKNTPGALFKGKPGSGSFVDIQIVDFPYYGVPVTMRNETTKVFNFLYDFTAESEFWTILTAMSPIKVLQYLGYCHWRVQYKSSFIWRSGKPLVSMNWGSLTILDQEKGEFAPGAPLEIDLQPILANPVRPLANDVINEQYRFAVKGGGGEFWYHIDSDKGLSPVVPNFWG